MGMFIPLYGLPVALLSGMTPPLFWFFQGWVQGIAPASSSTMMRLVTVSYMPKDICSSSLPKAGKASVGEGDGYLKYITKHFTCYVAGEGVHDDNVADPLKLGVHPAVGPLLQRFGFDRLSRAQHYGRHRCFSPFFVGNSKHSHFGHRVMLDHHFLNVPGINIDSAGNDHVLDPVDQEEIAVLIHITGIAGVQPAVNNGLFG